MPGRLFVVSGPSGAGKGTLVGRVMDRREGIWLSVSATTRAPREGEIDGESYFFMSTGEFEEKIASGGFLEWAKVHDSYYGTLRAPVVERISEGVDVLLEIDPQGAFQVRDNYPDAYLIFVKSPSFDDLRKRLEGRGTETAEQIERRLETAKLELEQEQRYNYSLVNDNIERATAELLSVMDSQC